MAATLATGEGAALSHRSAAELWTLIPGCSSFVHVTAPGRGGRKPRKGLIVHRLHTPPQTTIERGICVTTAAQTLRDLQQCVGRRRFERLVGEAERLGLCSESELRRLTPAYSATENDFEQRLLELCHHHQVPRPQCQVPLGNYRADFLWPAQLLIVETDGHATHGTRRAFEDDRARDVELTTRGYRVLRFTWRQLTERPDWVARKVEQALGRR